MDGTLGSVFFISTKFRGASSHVRFDHFYIVHCKRLMLGGFAFYLFEKVFFFYETPYWPTFTILAMFSESGRKGGTPLG